MRAATLLALSAPLASAVLMTYPTLNSTLTRGDHVKVTWDYVSTDAPTLGLYLVEFVHWPPFFTPLALDVDTASRSHTVRLPCFAQNNWGYQINAINGTNTYVIYAQTPRFTITGANCTDPPGALPICVPAGTNTMSSRDLHAAPKAARNADTVIGWGTKGYSEPVTVGGK